MTPIRRLIAAAGLTNLGNGIAVLAWAGSLLTRDALWVVTAPTAVRLPWVVLALPAGVLADRHDRRSGPGARLRSAALGGDSTSRSANR